MPNARIRSAGKNGDAPAAGGASVHPFAVGAWRGPGANMNVFAAESQIDIMATALRVDPLEFRLRNLTDARMIRVLQAAATAFGWKSAPAPSGRGFGLACSIDAGSYVATMAEVKVDAATGRVKVLRIVCAQDMGVVVNPDGAKMQIEGASQARIELKWMPACTNTSNEPAQAMYSCSRNSLTGWPDLISLRLRSE
jgi:CO/xanthine dehydrogenase Mo-binding subunit